MARHVGVREIAHWGGLLHTATQAICFAFVDMLDDLPTWKLV
jgi:hypothetical protein